MSRSTIAPCLAGLWFTAHSLSSCSGTVEFSPEARQRLRAVSVSKDVGAEGSLSGSLPELAVDTRGSVWFSSLVTAPVGVVFEVVDWSGNRKHSAERFEEFLEDSGVDVATLARNEFLRGLANAHLFDSIYADPGQATFRLSVEHGLSDGLGWRGSWKPWVTIVATLAEGLDGRTLWRYESSVDAADPRVPEVEFPTRQAAFLRKSYAKAVELATEELITHLGFGRE